MCLSMLLAVPVVPNTTVVSMSSHFLNKKSIRKENQCQVSVVSKFHFVINST